jgi:hypothetical protein
MPEESRKISFTKKSDLLRFFLKNQKKLSSYINWSIRFPSTYEITREWNMNDSMRQYRINTSWRNHVIRFIEAKRTASKYSGSGTNNRIITSLDYCNNDRECAKALDTWLEYMEEEERYSFYVHFATSSIDEAIKSLNILIDRKDSDQDLRMPLLRDSITSYSRPFKSSHGRLEKRYRLTEIIGVPSPVELHNRIIGARDQLYAHCDLSVKAPRVSKIGISLRMAGHYWSDYEALLPTMAKLMDNALLLIRQYIAKEGMNDVAKFFKKFKEADDLTASEPVLLDRFYGNESSK